MESPLPFVVEINQSQIDHNITTILEASMLAVQSERNQELRLIYDAHTGNLSKLVDSNKFLTVTSSFVVGRDNANPLPKLKGLTKVSFEIEENNSSELTPARITILCSLLATAYGADWRNDESINKLTVMMGAKKVDKDELKKKLDSVNFKRTAF
jgi:hypothetical protein